MLGEKVIVSAGHGLLGYRGVVVDRAKPIHIFITGDVVDCYVVKMTAPDHSKDQHRVFPGKCLSRDCHAGI